MLCKRVQEKYYPCNDYAVKVTKNCADSLYKKAIRLAHQSENALLKFITNEYESLVLQCMQEANEDVILDTSFSQEEVKFVFRVNKLDEMTFG